jgi:hypothetical protein
MSHNLPPLQSGANRKIVCDDATAASLDPDHIAAEEAEKQAVYEQHYSRIIVDWVNENGNTLQVATQSELLLPIDNMIHGNILSVWEDDLTAAGYTVTRGNAIFKIELPV